MWARNELAFWEANLQAFSRGNGQVQLSWCDSAIAVGNIVDLLKKNAFAAEIVKDGASLLSRLVSRSHVEWAFGIDAGTLQVPVNEDVDMDDDEFEAASTHGQELMASLDLPEVERVRAASGAKSLGSNSVWTQYQFRELVSSQVVRRLFSVASSSGGVLDHVSQVYATVLLAYSRSYLVAVRQSFKAPPPILFSLLSALTGEESSAENQEPIVRTVWNAVRRSSIEANGFNSQTLRPLLLFNTIFSHMLLSLDDETFYDRAWPFQLQEISEIVGFLKKFIYDVCWNVRSSNQSLNDNANEQAVLFPTLTTSVKLFNQLYDRDCRRRFTSDGDWLWPSMPVIKETVDLESMEGELFELQALSSLMNPTASISNHVRAAFVLTTIPQVFSFTDRVQLFEKLLDDEKRNMMHVRDEFSRAIQVRIKRDDIVDDSFEFFQKVCDAESPAILKSRIKVTFINEQGLEEAGIDGGGVFKEYIDQLTKNAFSSEYAFFLSTTEHLLYPNPSARMLVDTHKDVLDRYRFLGRVLGKAVYESILVEPQFAAFFLNKLLGKYNYIDDLYSLDPELYRHLMQLKHYTGNVEDLALTFSVSETEFGQNVTRSLVKDGANIPVTNANRIQYIHLLANHKLNVLSSAESQAFLRGFRDLIPAKWIQMFSPSELQMLIGGSANKIDIQDWQRHTAYGGGYHPSQRPIQWFWDIVEHDFSAEDRAALLKFITSVSRQPLLGFGQLAPQICIHQVRIDDDERLPSSATCMNLLKLPTYSSKEIMKQKLLYAIRSNAGFDLS